MVNVAHDSDDRRAYRERRLIGMSRPTNNILQAVIKYSGFTYGGWMSKAASSLTMGFRLNSKASREEYSDVNTEVGNY